MNAAQRSVGLDRPKEGPTVVSTAKVPDTHEPWLRSKRALLIGPRAEDCELNSHRAKAQLSDTPWVLPAREHLFLTDMHADGDALLASLVASGGIERVGTGDEAFILSPSGKKARFVFGGDYFDKGPSNLRVLRILRKLKELDADAVFLAGNHDVRTYLGICYAEDREVLRRHLFVRMGKKTLTLLHEIYLDYVEAAAPRLSDEVVKERLFPDEAWYGQFAQHAAGLLRPDRIDKELARIREKAAEVESRCATLGMTLGDLYEALRAARQLFLAPKGEFSWLFGEMQLAYRTGSLVFVHAGLDDRCAQIISDHGLDALNEQYAEALRSTPFECYNGPLGNCFRTKYRDGDFPFTSAGARHLRSSGVYALVHGHRNLRAGQRLILRHGILNIECDASVDCNTRAQENLKGPGAAVTIIRGNQISGISTDHASRKRLRPSDFGASSVTTIEAHAPSNP
jgi:hypothetical protein